MNIGDIKKCSALYSEQLARLLHDYINLFYTTFSNTLRDYYHDYINLFYTTFSNTLRDYYYDYINLFYTTFSNTLRDYYYDYINLFYTTFTYSRRERQSCIIGEDDLSLALLAEASPKIHLLKTRTTRTTILYQIII